MQQPITKKAKLKEIKKIKRQKEKKSSFQAKRH
jgi:hypothetical protein